jgi:hypothetical protein
MMSVGVTEQSDGDTASEDNKVNYFISFYITALHSLTSFALSCVYFLQYITVISTDCWKNSVWRYVLIVRRDYLWKLFKFGITVIFWLSQSRWLKVFFLQPLPLVAMPGNCYNPIPVAVWHSPTFPYCNCKCVWKWELFLFVYSRRIWNEFTKSFLKHYVYHWDG